MSRASYGDPASPANYVELVQVRVANLVVTPERDPTGIDVIGAKIDLTMDFQ